MKVTAVERIAHRDLRYHSSSILRRVAAGESFEVTKHGEVMTVLSPHGSRLTAAAGVATASPS